VLHDLALADFAVHHPESALGNVLAVVLARDDESTAAVMAGQRLQRTAGLMVLDILGSKVNLHQQ
jgi:hypothetical protein